MSKRTINSFFLPPSKRCKQDVATLSRQVSPPRTADLKHAGLSQDENEKFTYVAQKYTSHAGYAFPIADLPPSISDQFDELLLTASGKEMKDQPHLDLLYFEPLIPRPTADELFRFLRSSLPFYRVKYKITRFGKTIDINTPRYTTVFGIDETSRFIIDQSPREHNQPGTHLTTNIVETKDPSKKIPPGKYNSCLVPPRPIPPCLDMLKTVTEALTQDTYNFVLVNYYSTGQDSISYHSDDERFLGDNPTIASFSLGARRDFFMKHKPPGTGTSVGNRGKSNHENSEGGKEYPGTTQIKLPLGSGDMILMRGQTQRHWLHAVPKRSGKNNEAEKGRINITMRKNLSPGGTENYYQYNVGTGPVYRWDEKRSEMRLWTEMEKEGG